MEIHLPSELRASYKVHNGQGQVAEVGTVGLLGGLSLLPLPRLVDNYLRLRKFAPETELIIPLTEGQSHTQWVMRLSGEVILSAGWNAYPKAASWLELFRKLIE